MPAGRALAALGYEQITGLTVAKGMNIPPRTSLAVIIAEGAAVRYRDDGIAPTAALEMPLSAGTILMYDIGQFPLLRFIEQAATAKLNISYYG